MALGIFESNCAFRAEKWLVPCRCWCRSSGRRVTYTKTSLKLRKRARFWCLPCQTETDGRIHRQRLVAVWWGKRRQQSVTELASDLTHFYVKVRFQDGMHFCVEVPVCLLHIAVQGAVILLALAKGVICGNLLPGRVVGEGEFSRMLILKEALQVSLSQLVRIVNWKGIKALFLLLCVDLPEGELQVADFGATVCAAGTQKSHHSRYDDQWPAQNLHTCNNGESAEKQWDLWMPRWGLRLLPLLLAAFLAPLPSSYSFPQKCLFLCVIPATGPWTSAAGPFAQCWTVWSARRAHGPAPPDTGWSCFYRTDPPPQCCRGRSQHTHKRSRWAEPRRATWWEPHKLR